MTIATNIEAALSRYLSNESDSTVGGLYLLKTQSGGGTQVAIRTGHDDAGDIPDAGFILCFCNDSDVVQPVISLNLFHAPFVVQLAYPGDDYASDTETMAAFQYLEQELERLLVRDDLHAELTLQGEGQVFHGPTEGIVFQTSLDGRRRVAEWRFTHAVSGVNKQI